MNPQRKDTKVANPVSNQATTGTTGTTSSGNRSTPAPDTSTNVNASSTEQSQEINSSTDDSPANDTTSPGETTSTEELLAASNIDGPNRSPLCTTASNTERFARGPTTDRPTAIPLTTETACGPGDSSTRVRNSMNDFDESDNPLNRLSRVSRVLMPIQQIADASTQMYPSLFHPIGASGVIIYSDGSTTDVSGLTIPYMDPLREIAAGLMSVSDPAGEPFEWNSLLESENSNISRPGHMGDDYYIATYVDPDENSSILFTSMDPVSEVPYTTLEVLEGVEIDSTRGIVLTARPPGQITPTRSLARGATCAQNITGETETSNAVAASEAPVDTVGIMPPGSLTVNCTAVVDPSELVATTDGPDVNDLNTNAQEYDGPDVNDLNTNTQEYDGPDVNDLNMTAQEYNGPDVNDLNMTVQEYDGPDVNDLNTNAQEAHSPVTNQSTVVASIKAEPTADGAEAIGPKGERSQITDLQATAQPTTGSTKTDDPAMQGLSTRDLNSGSQVTSTSPEVGETVTSSNTARQMTVSNKLTGQTTGPTKVGQVAGPPKAGQTTGPTKAGQTTGLQKVGQTTGPQKVGQTTGPTKVGQTTGPTKTGQSTGPTRAGHTTGTTKAGNMTGPIKVGNMTSGQTKGGQASLTKPGPTTGSSQVGSAMNKAPNQGGITAGRTSRSASKQSHSAKGTSPFRKPPSPSPDRGNR